MFPLALYRVSGSSMEPTYKAGDLLLGWKWFKPQVNQVVVVRRPERTLIKRIKQHHVTNFWIEGDNPAHSSDSHNFGPVPQHQIQALIIHRF